MKQSELSTPPKAGDQAGPATKGRPDGSEELGRVGQKAGEKGRAAAKEAKERAQNAADEQMRIGADHMQRISGAITNAADELDSSSPLIAHYARSLASGLSDISGSIRSRRAGDLLHDGTQYARREPIVFLGAAILSGFVLSRFLKSSGGQAGRGSTVRSD